MSKKLSFIHRMGLFLSLALGAHQILAQSQATMPQLQTGKPIERQMTGADTHSYFVDLRAGQLIDLVVEQRGIDVVLRMFAPTGQKVAEVDSPNGAQGPEPLWMISEMGGRYRLEIKPFAQGAAAGGYTVRVRQMRDATRAEREVSDLDKQFITAWAAADVQTLDRITADDLTYTSYAASPNASPQDKAAFLASTKTRAATGTKYTTVANGVRVGDYGDTAIITGHTTSSFTFNNTPLETRVQFLRAYARRNNRWQLIAAQHTGSGQLVSGVAGVINPNRYDEYAGEYQTALAPNLKFTVTKEESRLMLRQSGVPDAVELMPETPLIFFSNVARFHLVFARDGNGQISELTLIPYVNAGPILQLRRVAARQR
jgi:uncharacterized protein (TIGR02246 family)